MATNTFDTSRVGGGTYELEKDSSGNYKLKSVGFAQVNKLNLPDLKTSDNNNNQPKILPVEDEKTVADPYKKLFKQTEGGGGGGGQDYSGVMLKTPEVKDAEVRQAGDPMVKYSPTEYNKKWVQDTQIPGVEVDPDKAGNWRENVQIPGTTTFTDPNYKSPTMAMKEQEFAQGKYTPKATGLQKPISKASDAISKTKKIIGNVAKMLIPGANLISKIAPEETATQKLNKSYFNVRGGSVDGQRIAGNPATDLYAGFNRTSDFGNLERAGDKRIATREKTIAKYEGKWDKEKMDRFKDTTNNMKRQAVDYKAKKKGLDTKNPNEMRNINKDSGGGNGGGSDSGRVICTDLHRTGELSTRDWIRDTKFTFKTLSIKHVKGYLLWAEPTVRHIQKYPRYRKIWKHIAQHRANDIAWRLNEGKFDLLGRIYAGIGEPVCWMLGNFVSDKQISKYNLTHWRRA